MSLADVAVVIQTSDRISLLFLSPFLRKQFFVKYEPIISIGSELAIYVSHKM